MARRTISVGRTIALVSLATLGLSCASPPDPDPEAGSAWGYVKLVPRSGTPAGAGGGYGDRRLADVKRFDYSHMKFAVVFAPGSFATEPVPTKFTISTASERTSFEPRYAAANARAGIEVTNHTGMDQLISIPRSGKMLRIPSGESVGIKDLELGESSLHLLGSTDSATPASAQLWVTDGSWAVVEPSGRFTLRGLTPGERELRAWHPRLPPSAARTIHLERGSVHRVDFELGVDARQLQSKDRE